MKTGRVYKIISTQGNEIYIGSTFNTTRDRFREHRKNYNSWKQDDKNKYISSYKLFEKYGVHNCKIIMIKEYNVCDRKNLQMYECLWICKLNENCVNDIFPFSIKYLYMKKYFEERKEEKKEYDKQRYINNKDIINEKRYKKFECECGGKYMQMTKKRHIETKKHKKWLELNE